MTNETCLDSSCFADQASSPRFGVCPQSGFVDHKHRSVVRVGWLQRWYGW
jgi:hypothetical protein